MSFTNLPIWETAGAMVIGSLWLGALLAFVFWALVKIWGRGSATFRYYSALSMLILFTIGNAYIAYHAKTTATRTISLDTLTTASYPWAGISANNQVNGNNLVSWVSNQLELINPYKAQLGFIWWLGLVFLTIRFLGGYFLAQRLRYRRIRPVEDYWQDKLQLLATTIGLKEKVVLLESYLIESPVTLGYWRPVILLPVSLLTTIPVAQIEAVLLHELYHIKYRDYCINLFQTALEIIFFYHPLVWWLSRIIREEREYRCDDATVTTSGDRIALAKALTFIKMSHFKPQNPITMSLTEKKTKLSHRIYRLFEPRPSFSYKMRGLLSLCFLIIMSSAFTLFKPQIADNTLATTSVDSSSFVASPNEEDKNAGEDPIYVKDGKRISKNAMESIDPEQISSIEVWKGEAAIKKYGDKAHNGVVFIYTKGYTDNGKIENEEDFNKVMMGEPGSGAKIDIRQVENNARADAAGLGNSGLTGPKNPLFILDGELLESSKEGEVPTEIASLDPASIDEISVLKGEEATKKYGREGADGVVIITTKDFKEAE